MKSFNVTGLCVPAKHYMVDLTERVQQICKMVDAGEYFTINCARQYGKTTTLAMLAKSLYQRYLVISLDFQALGSASFQDENTFSIAFLFLLLRELKRQQMLPIPHLEELSVQMQDIVRRKDRMYDLLGLFDDITSICANSQKPIVLMVDEIDSASNYQVFLDFLSQLRSCYLERDMKGVPAFQSVILAGVYDVKNLKRKLRPQEQSKGNSPWNIAADFDIDMGLSMSGIRGMLEEYDKDYHIGMDVEQMSGLLYNYTSGYPYLVSRLCKLMDEKLCNLVGLAKKRTWTKDMFLEAVRMLLSENNTLFESLIAKLTEYPELSQILRELLFLGKTITYSPTNQVMNLALMFGAVKKEKGKIVPANRIFDTLLYDYFLSADEMRTSDLYKASLQDKNHFIEGGHLNMRRVLEKFTEHFHELYGNQSSTFLEEEGRRYFLLYLRPIINGTGNYYVEARTRSLGRTDIIIDYRGEQFIVETKIWRGNEYHLRGECQLADYLKDYQQDIGYLLSFNFNKKKQVGVQEIIVNEKRIIEAVV